ncbi:unnamed protein product [Dracunculus medinensis]|uniref:Aminopeptidase n=1 Tax=Dracunculus medinensis TaxID=318479 RepID=A0A0N4U4M3_DRAME|nr:unnamed protein product [Dracunculus medinensis]
MTSCTPCHMQLVSLNYRLYDQSHERPTVVNNVDEISGPTIAELRIPADLSPLWYNLTIKIYLPGFVDFPNEKNLTFDGSICIKFQDEEMYHETSEKTIEKRSYNDSSNLEMYDGESINDVQEQMHFQVTTMYVDEAREKVTFELSEELIKGNNYYLQFNYSGSIEEKLVGLYLSRYTDDFGQNRFMAITQMEPARARYMVPCFDEPEFKAVWKLQIIHPSGTTAISNGMEIGSAVQMDDSNWLLSSFEESLPMSSYLLALAVTDFAYNEGTTNKGIRFRVWSRKEAINDSMFALESGIKALEFFEDYYQIAFPLKKQDMIAIPDFAARGMENWGLITYRESVLLYNPKAYTIYQKCQVAAIVAHELAHQWFGNLVTMKWWNDLWLNEGFATFMQYMGVDAINGKSFRMDEYFIYLSLTNALYRDAQSTSHPLLFSIDKPEDVSEVFDSITYEKGASIIHMIENILGAENFKKGLNIYLEKHKYGNTDHDDLWESLNNVVPEELKAWDGQKFNIHYFASMWTEQMGYPVVEVRRLDSETIQLHQNRFKWSETTLEKEKYRNAKYKYDIPIWYQINSEEKPMTWLHEAEIIGVKPHDLFIVNSQSRGFYRVNYDQAGWERIREQLMTDHTKIDVKSRGRIMADLFALAEANIVPYELALNISLYLKNIIGMYCAVRNLNCTQRLARLFEEKFLEQCADSDQMSSDCSRVPLSIRALAYCEGVKQGAEDVWNNVQKIYSREKIEVERQRLLQALCCSRDSFTLKKLLNLAVNVSDTTIRYQDTSRVFASVARESVGSLLMFNYLLDNWQCLYNELIRLLINRW